MEKVDQGEQGDNNTDNDVKMEGEETQPPSDSKEEEKSAEDNTGEGEGEEAVKTLSPEDEAELEEHDSPLKSRSGRPIRYISI